MILYESSKKYIGDCVYVRCAWLRGQEPLCSTSARLIDLLRAFGIHLDLYDYSLLSVIPFWRYDLIVIEQARHQKKLILLAAIKRVRTLSYAPLVVLTRQMAPEFIIDGLLAGADSISSITCCERVLSARWRALLKRWKPTAFISVTTPYRL